jgi:hypothetical protein
MMGWTRHMKLMGEAKNKNMYKILVGKSEGMRPLGRPRLRWVNNITVVLRDIG